MLHINFSIRTTPNKRKECPIMVLLQDSNTKDKYSLRTGVFCPIAFWDKETSTATSKWDFVNTHLISLQNGLRDVETRFLLTKEPYTPRMIWEDYKVPTTKLKYEKPVLEVLKEVNENKLASGTFGKGNYKTCKSIIKKLAYFLKDKGMGKVGYNRFNSVYAEFVNVMRYTRFTKKSEIYQSETAVKNSHLRRIKQKLMEGNTYAINNGYTSTNLLKLDSLKNDDTVTEFLLMNEVRALKNLDLSQNKELENIRDIFLFISCTSLLACDMKVFDAKKHLYTDENGKEWIIKPREKTGEVQRIPMMLLTKQLLEKWDYVLPLQAEQIINRELKTLCKQVGITKKITMRSGRKTAGMMFLNAGVTMESVSKILGHKNILITQRHYASIDLERLEKDTDFLRYFDIDKPKQAQTTPQTTPQADMVALRQLEILERIEANLNKNNQ